MTLLENFHNEKCSEFVSKQVAVNTKTIGQSDNMPFIFKTCQWYLRSMQFSPSPWYVGLQVHV